MMGRDKLNPNSYKYLESYSRKEKSLKKFNMKQCEIIRKAVMKQKHACKRSKTEPNQILPKTQRRFHKKHGDYTHCWLI